MKLAKLVIAAVSLLVIVGAYLVLFYFKIGLAQEKFPVISNSELPYVSDGAVMYTMPKRAPQLLAGADATTFKRISQNITIALGSQDSAAEILLAFYADKSTVYLFEVAENMQGMVDKKIEKVADADPQTFTIDSATTGHDKNHTYTTQWSCQGQDCRFTVIASK